MLKENCKYNQPNKTKEGKSYYSITKEGDLYFTKNNIVMTISIGRIFFNIYKEFIKLQKEKNKEDETKK